MIRFLNFEFRQCQGEGEGIDPNIAQMDGMMQPLREGRHSVGLDGVGHGDKAEQRVEYASDSAQENQDWFDIAQEAAWRRRSVMMVRPVGIEPTTLQLRRLFGRHRVIKND